VLLRAGRRGQEWIRGATKRQNRYCTVPSSSHRTLAGRGGYQATEYGDGETGGPREFDRPVGPSRPFLVGLAPPASGAALGVRGIAGCSQPSQAWPALGRQRPRAKQILGPAEVPPVLGPGPPIGLALFLDGPLRLKSRMRVTHTEDPTRIPQPTSRDRPLNHTASAGCRSYLKHCRVGVFTEHRRRHEGRRLSRRENGSCSSLSLNSS